jgi:hypothetical protein
MARSLGLLGCAAVGLLTAPGFAGVDAPPPAPAQIEADWLRQDAKRQLPAAGAAKVTRQEDAAGGVDGLKDGKWGFHTENEKDPWWQVDLGQTVSLGQVVLYNRCDGHAERNTRILVLLSADGQNFQQVYQHDGTVFYGQSDGKPLRVDLRGAPGRFVRLALKGNSYFHLDEVEVYAAGATTNLALGRPATQSSLSQWSVAHRQPAVETPSSYPFAVVRQRGLQLAQSQRRLGADVTQPWRTLEQAAEAWQNLTEDAPQAVRRELYFRAHWAVRAMSLANPLLGFDSILFVKRAPGMFPHMSDQHYGWWSRGGGGLYVLEGYKTGQPRLRRLTDSFAEGNFAGPDLSWDGRRVLFAYCKYFPALQDEKTKADKQRLPEEAFYHLYEMNLDGTGLRQLTAGKYDDFDPRYLPNGEIAFLSTRKGQAIQCTQWFSDATRTAQHPDSYVRCGGDNARPVPVFTLHFMEESGRNIRPLSAFENFEWTPSVANDGRVLYTRWDYIDRFNGHFFSLWSAGQDGANPQLVYGNYTVKPQVVLEARSIPGSAKLVFTAAAHHSNTGGSLCLLDRPLGTELEAPLTRLTPEVCFPETEGWPEHYYANPWPLSEEYFLVGWADAKLPPHTFVKDHRNPPNAMGIYLYDAFGNLELLYRDPAISSMHPIPVAVRPKPPVHAPLAQWQGAQEGRFLLQDVYRGLEPAGRGSIKRLRIVAVPPKVQPHMNNPVLGVSAEDPGRYILGTVPVEADGSAYFRVPSGVPVLFQALDEKGLAVQTMRSLTYTLPGQTLACVGCHEHRDQAPPAAQPILAARREPSRLTPGPSGSWPLRFDQLVQPVLDQQCVGCHRPGGKEPQAARLDLSPTNAWKALLAFAGEDLKKLAFERDRSVVGEGTAARSKLWSHLAQPGGHKELKLDADSLDRLATWMDTYAHRQGHFSDEQEKQLQAFRTALAKTILEPAR